MSWLEILLISFGVSVDSFAVSVGGALSERDRLWRAAVIAALYFGGFQFLMPVAGYFLAGMLSGAFDAWDHWIAFVLLALVGGKMFVEALFCREEEKSCAGIFTPLHMIVPALATSCDALAVGAGFSFAGYPLWLPAAAMGVVTALVSAVGVMLGGRLGRAMPGEKYVAAAGGVVIVCIGGKVLLAGL
ncbi:MAG: manganese efflux pump MntP family protein [Victivallaceae bacterium]|nr:manganese efflux pump MntP family protein [Victivallaceae bacterium]